MIKEKLVHTQKLKDYSTVYREKSNKKTIIILKEVITNRFLYSHDYMIKIISHIFKIANFNKITHYSTNNLLNNDISVSSKSIITVKKVV